MKKLLIVISVACLIGGIQELVSKENIAVSILMILTGLVILFLSFRKKKQKTKKLTKFNTSSKTTGLFLKDYTVIDFETTGLDPEHDEIVEVGAIRVRDYNIVEEFSSFIKPKRPISPEVSAINGITNEMLKYAPDQKTIINKLIDFMGA